MIPDIAISFGGKHPARILTAERLPWAQVVALFSKTPPEVDDKAAEGWYACAEFRPAYRDHEYLLGRTALTLDYDHIQRDDVARITAALEPYAFIAYTTYSHTQAKPRLRVIIPFDRLATAEEFQAVSRRVASWAGIELASRESHAPAQMMYLPARPTGGKFKALVGESDAPLVVDEILATYDNWHDRLSWPRRAEHDDISKDEIPPPPDTKPGVVGDFCRAFRIPDAIARFDLPYTPVSDGRWTYTHGSRPEGAVEYDAGLKLHSHHDTDPARGQHNAFDLVRLHRFGSLDASLPPDTAVTDLPSYQAMCQLAIAQPEVRQQVANAEFEEITPTPAPGKLPMPTTLDGIERFRVISATEFAHGRPLEWLIADILPKAELAVLYGESGSGKSFLTLDLCCAITRGIEWRGRKAHQGSVVYVAAEGAGGFRARLRAYAQSHGVGLDMLPAVVSDSPNFLMAEEIAAAAKQIQNWGKPSLIVIDTLSASSPGGNENSGEDMGLVISHCKFLHRVTGALVLLIHHSGKDAAKGARGWSGLKAAADAEFEVSRMGDLRTVRVSKMKDGEDGTAYCFKLKTVTIGLTEDGEETSCVIEHTEAPANRAKREEPSGADQRIVWRTLKTMSPDGSTVDLDDLHAGSSSKVPEGYTKAEFKKIIKGLISREYMFDHGGGRVSWTQLQGESNDEQL